MTLRKATIDDAEKLGAVHVASWRETYAGILPDEMLAGLSIKARAATWAKIISDPRTFAETAVYVIEEEGSIVGFGACGRQRDDRLVELGFEAEISSIYLLQSQQRKGAGRALMREMATDIRARGYSAAALWVIRENTAARTFYQRLGGLVVAQKEDKRGDIKLVEIAYGWHELSPLIHGPLLEK